jgi:hydrogenase-4 transcriptional activator
MENFNRILVQVWREACRDIEIEKSCAAISKMLIEHMPLEQVVLRGVDNKTRQIRTLVVGFPAPEESIPPPSSPLTVDQWEVLIRFLDRMECGQSNKLNHVPDLLPLLISNYDENDKIMGPLRQDGQVIGFLVWIAKLNAPFEEKHRRMCEILLEPFSIALQNDLKLRELQTLREAAEADKKSLLVKLSRDGMEETIIGDELGLKTVLERVAMIARSDVPVLIFGETGTGKELISRAIHNRSDRAQGPFIRVNCGAIPSELIDSQLFGHEKGAFTGAVETRKGWFERADGGTLFLDEVGEMPLDAQIRLLRILQDGWMERVGGKQASQVDVRVVLATHRDLASMVAQGRFREDLWYRISTFPIFLPPLRDRIQDLKSLADHFARRSAIRFGLPVILPDEMDIKLLSSYSWPGNIRELGAVMDRAALLGNGKSLEIEKALGWSQPVEISNGKERAAQTQQPFTHQIGSLDEAIKKHIEAALIQCKGRIEGKDGAAALLEINPHTLRGRMRKLKIQWSDYRNT